jgi:hypothetical protein
MTMTSQTTSQVRTFDGRVFISTARLPVVRDHYADVMEAMFAAYEDDLSLGVIVDVVDRCRSDLAGSPSGAMPELLHRLAGHRLSELVQQH